MITPSDPVEPAGREEIARISVECDVSGCTRHELPVWAEVWTHWMDEAVRVPGTNIRFGLDSILGLLFPAAGDALTAVGGLSLLILGFRMRLPKIVLGRMLVNVAADAIIGTVPLLGDLFDVGWKANRKNLQLIRRFRGMGSLAPSVGDYAMVIAAVVALLGIVLIPVAVVVLLGVWLGAVL